MSENSYRKVFKKLLLHMQLDSHSFHVEDGGLHLWNCLKLTENLVFCEVFFFSFVTVTFTHFGEFNLYFQYLQIQM